MREGLKSLPMGYLSMAEHNWRWTPQSSRLCIVTALPQPGASNVDGVRLLAARRRKERTYPELVAPRSRCRMVVLANEVGGRWSTEALVFLRLLAGPRPGASHLLCE